MYKNGRDGVAKNNIRQRVFFVCRIPKASKTHSEEVMLITFHSNNGYENAFSITLYAHCSSWYNFVQSHSATVPQIRPLSFLPRSLKVIIPWKIVFWVFPRRLSIKIRRFGTLCRFHLHQVVKMERTQSSETSGFNTQTPGKYPEDYFSLLQL
jgi:hypothetical protein